MNQSDVKKKIRQFAQAKEINIKKLSLVSEISMVKLLCLLYTPFQKIKLFQALRICKSLDVNIRQLF